jgi:hypothetical protein
MADNPRFKFPENDPFDTSTNVENFDKTGLPTVERVEELESIAKTLFQLKKGQEAADALDLFAKQANALANIVVSTLKPYYDASYEARSNFTDISELAKLESRANDYKTKRNRAMVMRAECLLALGREAEAAGLLMNALDLIALDDANWWKRARENLLKVVGVK